MGTSQTPEPGRQRRARSNPGLLRPADVAEAFGVDPKTVVRWDNDGRLPEEATIRTPGRQRRFRRDVMERAYPGVQFPPPPAGGGAE